MDINTIAYFTGLSASVIKELLTRESAEVYRDPRYLEALRRIDVAVLENTLPDARDIYEEYLPEFSEMLAKRYGVDTAPMSPFTLGNWVVGVLHYPERADSLIDMHARLGREVFAENVDSLIGILDYMGNGKEVWQQAMVLLSFPLMAR